MSPAESIATANERQNRSIALIVAILRRYGAIELTRQGIVVSVALGGCGAGATQGASTEQTDTADGSVRAMRVEEIEYAGEGSFALRVTDASEGTRLTKKAAAARRAQTERRIVVRRDGAAEYPRIAPDGLDRVREAVEAFDRG